MNKTEVNETVKAASLYLTRLKWLSNELNFAVKQIEHTFEETETNVRETFCKLRETFTAILYKREKDLMDKAKKTKSDSLAPLRECRAYILEKIEATVKLINTGTSIANDGKEDIVLFSKNASQLGSLPEVPELKDVPYLSFYYEPLVEIDIIEKLANIGDIYKIPPVQIGDLIEKPGAILVEWKVVVDNDEKLTDIEEFRLQKVFGDVTKEKHLVIAFQDCYRGLDSQFLIKELKDNQPYSFRVCCKFEGSTEWSPWSLAQMGCTTLKHYTWKYNSNYSYTNEYKVATPKANDVEMLYSDGAQFSVGDSIDFIFLDSDSSNAVIGLICATLEILPKTVREAKDSTFLMNKDGKIIVDGVEKATMLPAFHRGSKVTFMCSLVKEQKVRVSIDHEDKRVTYDWPVSPVAKMYFVAQFFSSKWKVMIE